MNSEQLYYLIKTKHFPGQFIEEVSVHEVVWCLFQGHHSREVKKQIDLMNKHNPKLLSDPDFGSWEENMLRLGCLSSCAKSSCPIVNLITHSFPFPDKEVGVQYSFSRVRLSKKGLMNGRDINKKLKISDFVKKYKSGAISRNKGLEEIREKIKNKNLFKQLNYSVWYCRNDDWIPLDGNHRMLSLACEYEKWWQILPNIDIICLNEPIEINKNGSRTKELWEI